MWLHGQKGMDIATELPAPHPYATQIQRMAERSRPEREAKAGSRVHATRGDCHDIKPGVQGSRKRVEANCVARPGRLSGSWRCQTVGRDRPWDTL